MSVRFLSWECWDFLRQHDHFRRFPKKSKVFRRSLPKAKLLRKLLSTKSEIARKVLSFIHFTHGFRSLDGWAKIFLEIVSSKTATTHIFQSGERNWPASVSRREIEVFNPQAWELAGIWGSWLEWYSKIRYPLGDWNWIKLFFGKSLRLLR